MANNEKQGVNRRMAYIVVATTNAHKVDEYRKLLEGQKVELKSLLDLSLIHISEPTRPY